MKSVLYTLLAAVFFVNITGIAYAQAPSNDLCSGATTITSGTSCSSTTGTLLNATQSSPNVGSSCAGTPGADVWYSFVAQTAYPVIALGSIGTNFRTK